LACLYKTLTLILYNSINLPNLMGACRSCGQLNLHVSHNIFDDIFLILAYGTLFSKFVWSSLCFICMIFNNPFQCTFTYVPGKVIRWAKFQYVTGHFCQDMNFWQVPTPALLPWKTLLNHCNKFTKRLI
jgi:hypothetical protein